jgi:small subunit ribosomal protein S5
LREGRTLHHDVADSFGAGKVIIRAAKAGTGIIAGGPMRAIFEALGVQDVVAKSVGSSNPHNMIKATFAALNLATSPRAVAARRGKKVNEVLGRRETEAKEPA